MQNPVKPEPEGEKSSIPTSFKILQKPKNSGDASTSPKKSVWEKKPTNVNVNSYPNNTKKFATGASSFTSNNDDANNTAKNNSTQLPASNQGQNNNNNTNNNNNNNLATISSRTTSPKNSPRKSNSSQISKQVSETQKNSDLEDIFSENGENQKIENESQAKTQGNVEDDMFDTCVSTGDYAKRADTHIPKVKKTILKRCPQENLKKEQEEKERKERLEKERQENEKTLLQRESNYAEARAKYFSPSETFENEQPEIEAQPITHKVASPVNSPEMMTSMSSTHSGKVNDKLVKNHGTGSPSRGTEKLWNSDEGHDMNNSSRGRGSYNTRGKINTFNSYNPQRMTSPAGRGFIRGNSIRGRGAPRGRGASSSLKPGERQQNSDGSVKFMDNSGMLHYIPAHQVNHPKPRSENSTNQKIPEGSKYLGRPENYIPGFKPDKNHKFATPTIPRGRGRGGRGGNFQNSFDSRNNYNNSSSNNSLDNSFSNLNMQSNSNQANSQYSQNNHHNNNSNNNSYTPSSRYQGNHRNPNPGNFSQNNSHRSNWNSQHSSHQNSNHHNNNHNHNSHHSSKSQNSQNYNNNNHSSNNNFNGHSNNRDHNSNNSGQNNRNHHNNNHNSHHQNHNQNPNQVNNNSFMGSRMMVNPNNPGGMMQNQPNNFKVTNQNYLNMATRQINFTDVNAMMMQMQMQQSYPYQNTPNPSTLQTLTPGTYGTNMSPNNNYSPAGNITMPVMPKNNSNTSNKPAMNHNNFTPNGHQHSNNLNHHQSHPQNGSNFNDGSMGQKFQNSKSNLNSHQAQNNNNNFSKGLQQNGNFMGYNNAGQVGASNWEG